MRNTGAARRAGSVRHRRVSKANLKVERFGAKSTAYSLWKISRPEHRDVLKKHSGAKKAHSVSRRGNPSVCCGRQLPLASKGSRGNSATLAFPVCSKGERSRDGRIVPIRRSYSQKIPLHLPPYASQRRRAAAMVRTAASASRAASSARAGSKGSIM